MLSDEEKQAIEILKDREYDFDELYCTFGQSFIKPYDKSIGIILKLIEKQQKEIERLEARKYMFNAETGEISQIPIDNNYISKDKIKAKIEEYEEQEKDEPNAFLCKRVLQSLLEKE